MSTVSLVTDKNLAIFKCPVCELNFGRRRLAFAHVLATHPFQYIKLKWSNEPTTDPIIIRCREMRDRGIVDECSNETSTCSSVWRKMKSSTCEMASTSSDNTQKLTSNYLLDEDSKIGQIKIDKSEYCGRQSTDGRRHLDTNLQGHEKFTAKRKAESNVGKEKIQKPSEQYGKREKSPQFQFQSSRLTSCSSLDDVFMPDEPSAKNSMPNGNQIISPGRHKNRWVQRKFNKNLWYGKIRRTQWKRKSREEKEKPSVIFWLPRLSSSMNDGESSSNYLEIGEKTRGTFKKNEKPKQRVQRESTSTSDTMYSPSNSSPAVQQQIYTCRWCHARFQKIQDVITHDFKKHKEIKRYRCHSCRFESSCRNELTKHLSEIHEGVLRCAECGERFYSQRDFGLHIYNELQAKMMTFYCQ